MWWFCVWLVLVVLFVIGFDVFMFCVDRWLLFMLCCMSVFMMFCV